VIHLILETSTRPRRMELGHKTNKRGTGKKHKTRGSKSSSVTTGKDKRKKTRNWRPSEERWKKGLKGKEHRKETNGMRRKLKSWGGGPGASET